MQSVDLRTARKKRGLDQAGLAKASGLNQATVSRLERGAIKRPTPETIEKLETALGLKPGRLAFGEAVAS